MHFAHRPGSSVRSIARLSLGSLGIAFVAFGAGCSKSSTSEAAAPASPPASSTAEAPAATSTLADASDTNTKEAAVGEETTKPVVNGASSASEGELQADAQAANTFALKAYVKARKGNPGNMLLSGTSLRHALGVAYLGARGETAHEMSATLGFPADPAKAAEVEKGENAAWQTAKGKAGDGAELVVADRLWADQSFPIAPAYKGLTESVGSDVATVDFVHAAEGARTTINDWVSDKTAKKIPELLAKGLVDARTRVVITNAIYFKGAWASPFMASATKDETFTQAGGKKITTPMMHATETFHLVEVANAKILEMRYQASDLAMTIVLPKDAGGLSKLEESLDASTFDAWTSKGGWSRVAVTLPKFTFGWGGSVSRTIQDLGIKTAFGDKADFSGIAAPQGKERIAISEIVHKTWIAVDEKGTEAAAATGVVMRTTGMPMGPVAEFKADHPFLFFIRDTKSGRILFVGRVVDPKAS